MLVVSVLSEESNSILGIIWITSWHIHIINEIDQLEFTNWSKCLTCFLLKALLHNHLEQVSICVKVEVDNLADVLFTS